MEKIFVSYKDYCSFNIRADEGIILEMCEFFTFYVEGYKFNPKYKSGIWDGKIRLISYYTKTLPAGLFEALKDFAKRYDYQVVSETNQFGTPGSPNPIDMDEVAKFFKNTPISFEDVDSGNMREHQVEALFESLKDKRNLLKMPTASGKSLVIYMLVRWIQNQLKDGKKIAIIVPTTQLVEQLYENFEEYSRMDSNWDPADHCNRVYSGKEKITEHDVIISTWQSFIKFPKKSFADVQALIGDEAHTFQAKSLGTIMNNVKFAEWRIGLSGTFKKTKTHQLQLVGHFGPIRNIISSSELMERGLMSKLEIEAAVLKYPKELTRGLGKIKYQDEIKFINTSERRNNFIANKALEQTGNTLISFKVISHGKSIYETLKKLNIDPNRKIFYVSGETKTAERERIRKAIEDEENSIVVASVVFLTGINIKNLHVIIFAAPVKSIIQVLQTLGRGLRVSKDGKTALLIDCIDDIKQSKPKNYAFKHGVERLSIYSSEKFKYKIVEYEL